MYSSKSIGQQPVKKIPLPNQQEEHFDNANNFENYNINNQEIDQIITQLNHIELIQKKIFQEINTQLSIKIDTMFEFIKGHLSTKIQQSHAEFNAKLNFIQYNQEEILEAKKQIVQSPLYKKQEESEFLINLHNVGEDEEIDKSRMDFQIKSIRRHLEQISAEQGIRSMKLVQLLSQRFQEMECQFDECELLYEFPKMSHIDFHQKIDSMNNILLVAQLKHNKNIVGAFTANCFKSTKNQIPKNNPKSFLFNITLDRVVYAHRTNKTLTYDKNYLIFGNWEIKIKNGGNVLETTWGNNGDSFSKRKFKVEGDLVRQKRQWLFGKGTNDLKQFQIEEYCIFQLAKTSSYLM